MSGPMGKPPLWKNCIFSDKRRILYRRVEKFHFSKIMHHTIKIQHASNCIPLLKFCKIVILADVVNVQANSITVRKMP